jgi:hypothetical protein
VALTDPAELDGWLDCSIDTPALDAIFAASY